MLSKNSKRIILITVDIFFSAFIFYVNASWKNPIYTCFILSLTTFLIVLIPFEVYWSFRDIWFDRWNKINLKNIHVEKISISVEGGSLSGAIYQLKISNSTHLSQNKPIIIISPGFSDLKEDLEYFFLPIVNSGYPVLAYDARGTGESKKVGKKADIKNRINDFLHIVRWIQKNDKLGNKEIYTAGFSIGALTILCGGFPLEEIKKIFAVSAIADFREDIPHFNPIVWLRYFFKGMHQFPNEETNLAISPYHVIKNFKTQNFSGSDAKWKEFTKKVMLVHAKNDRIVKFKNFIKNKALLELSEKNTLVFKKGGHLLKKNELSIVTYALNFFKN